MKKSISELRAHPQNPRKISPEQLAMLKKSLHEFGDLGGIIFNRTTGNLIGGHQRLKAIDGDAQIEMVDDTRGWILAEGHRLSYREVEWDPMREKAAMIAANKHGGEWDMELLTPMVFELKALEINMDLIGFSEEETKAMALDLPPTGSKDKSKTLASRFLAPPFSVLDARQGYWKDRKSKWLAMGIASEVGRAGNLLGMSATVLEPDPAKRAAMKATPGGGGGLESSAYKSFGTKKMAFSGGEMKRGDESVAGSGTSIFDPVLCELACRWFSPKGATILDPFAGGSVRGIVASKLGRKYIGIELRPEQVEANRAQADEICLEGEEKPQWINDDSRNLSQHISEPVDFVFSCPPYADLEVYSDDPRDLSTLGYEEFRTAYKQIIERAIAALKEDRFACFVVGEVRDSKGFYHGFVQDTIAAFESAGARLYNEAILVTSLGTLPIRTARMFTAGRKLGKTHQNVLIFVKGDPKKAVEACGALSEEDYQLDGSASELSADGQVEASQNDSEISQEQ